MVLWYYDTKIESYNADRWSSWWHWSRIPSRGLMIYFKAQSRAPAKEMKSKQNLDINELRASSLTPRPSLLKYKYVFINSPAPRNLDWPIFIGGSRNQTRDLSVSSQPSQPQSHHHGLTWWRAAPNWSRRPGTSGRTRFGSAEPVIAAPDSFPVDVRTSPHALVLKRTWRESTSKTC